MLSPEDIKQLQELRRQGVPISRSAIKALDAIAKKEEVKK